MGQFSVPPTPPAWVFLQSYSPPSMGMGEEIQVLVLPPRMRDRCGPFGRFEIVVKSNGFLERFSLAFLMKGLVLGDQREYPWGGQRE